MDEKYLKYSIEELIQDRDFVSWVIHQRKNKEWQDFIARNPEFAKSVKTAKKIIHLLEDSYDVLSEKDVYNLWMNIDRFDKQQKQQVKVLRLKRILRYAAVGFLLVALSGLSAIYFLRTPQTYHFAGIEQPGQSAESLLILSNGEQIGLKKDNSIVTLKDKEIEINNDSIIPVEEGKATRLAEIIVPFGKRTQLVLNDGTQVWLNAGSHFAFPEKFGPGSRNVYLEGEAYFEVTHNEHQPFHVNVDDLEVKVLGTKFNVSAYSSDAAIETVLLEGKVAINEHGSLAFLKEEVLLKPNQKATYNKIDRSTLVFDDKNADVSVAWVKGWFSFSQQGLVDVLKKLERYYNVRFQYDAGFSSGELISGKMELKNSLDNVLVFLSDLGNADFIKVGNFIQVKRRENK